MSDNAAQYFAKAQSFKDAGDYKSARTSLESAILQKPDFFEARVNLAESCRILGDEAAAILHLSYALKLKPGFCEGHNAMGLLLQKKGDYKGAVLALNRAIECKPDFALAHYNLGNCMRDIEELDQAIACFTMAVKLNPSSVEALSNLGEAFLITGRIKEAERCFQSVLFIDPSCFIAFSNYLLTINYDPELKPLRLYEEHRKFGSAITKPQTSSAFTNTMTQTRRLRIGYVSADFCNHPVSRFLEPVLTNHYATDFEVFCYSAVKNPDAKTDQLRRLPSHWSDIAGMPDHDLAEKIRSDAIDILIDLSGHTAENRLPVFALRPAPVQATYLGYPNTSGMKTMDYRITDRVADPLCEVPVHTEKLMRLSPCFCCYNPPDNAPLPGPLPVIKNNIVTFGSTHTMARLNDRLLDLWASLLSSMKGSRILLIRTTLRGSILDRVYSRFEARGIDTTRVKIRNTMPAEGHLAVYRDMDVFLDSFPWSGHTTACEALWMGVPVVTLRGDRHAGRMVASVLSCLDMKDCIAGTKDEYVTAARRLASDCGTLENLRATLRGRMAASPLCDGKTFTASLEEAYRTMWREHCEQAGGKKS
jgi:predicted O-linked N-acetylglucosamine transferase (SPINDLY family)